jgi:ketosteroid isomerase-like protein
MRVRWTALVVLTLACQSGGGAGAALTEQDKAAIRGSDSAFVAAVNAKDWTKASAYFTDDGMMLAPYGPTVSGRAEIEKWMAAYPPFANFTAASDEIEGHGDLAYNRGHYALDFTGGPVPMRDQGKYIAIFRKQADGTWKATRDIFNSDLMPPGMPADTARKP